MFYTLHVVEPLRYDSVLIKETNEWMNDIVPDPKPKDCITKALTCEDFRGIAISPIISKLFE